MKYVKLTARPDTWFKEGTEVYDYDCNAPYELRRVPLEEWEKCLDPADSWMHICVRGIRVCDNEIEAKNLNVKVGEEYWDGEYCSMDEFESEIVEESK